MEIRRKDRIISQMRIDKVLKEGTYGVLSTIGKEVILMVCPLIMLMRMVAFIFIVQRR